MKERLETDLKSALKRGDSELVSILRFLLAQVQSEEIKNRGEGKPLALSDEAVIAILKSEAKRRVEAIEMFKTGGRADLVAPEEKAVAIIREYLPAELGRDQVVDVVRRLRANGFDDFTTLMKQSMAELKGRADGKLVSDIVREVLNG